MFKKLFGKFSGERGAEIVSRSDPAYRQQQAEFYVRLLRDPTVDSRQPIVFHDQLGVVAFDFSEASLDALDEVLLSIRAEIPGSFDEFVATLPGLNLIVGLGYYLGLTIAYIGKMPIQWIGYEEALKLNPSLTKRLDTDLGLGIGENVTYPANVIGGMLFNPVPERTCAAYARTLIRGTPNPDPLLTGLGKANALVTALDAGEVSERDALVSIRRHCLCIPSIVAMRRRPPYAENWRPVLAEKNGVPCQMAFPNLEFADVFKRVEPDIKWNGVVPFSWLAEMLPAGVGLAIIIQADKEWVISPQAIALGGAVHTIR